MSITALDNNVPMNKILVFLLSGKAGVGKTFSANHILSFLHDSGFERVRYLQFARGVKEVAKYIGWDGRKHEKDRKLLQTIGNAGRSYDEDCWAKKVSNAIFSFEALPPEVIVIDDWRFVNEYKHLESFVECKIVALRVESVEREILRDTPAYYDISETSLDDFSGFDYIVNNPVSDPENIKKKLEKIVHVEITKNRR